MFRLPWGSGARNEKVPIEKENLPATIRHPLPMTRPPLLNKMKRKRGDSRSLPSPTTDYHAAKRRSEPVNHIKPFVAQDDGLSAPSQTQPHKTYVWIDESSALKAEVNNMMDSEKIEKDRVCADDTSTSGRPGQQEKAIPNTDGQCAHSNTRSIAGLRETITSQFSLEILLKHRELRLIDQEIAKCQVALEQLRRCQIIPYPAMTSKVEDIQSVSSGSGYTPETHILHPPPWGVVDGPYTRHYAKWLIPDPAFDVNVEASKPPQTAGKALTERTTRGSASDKGIAAGKSRSQRGSNNARLQALPQGYPEPKEEKGPMILKRSTDGQTVKLVCIDCQRDNFNSAQGFINHCRIAHGRGFASHDAAAIACGEVVEVDQTGSVMGESGGTTSASTGLVHPLIRSPHVTTSTQTNFSTSTTQPKHLSSSTETTKISSRPSIISPAMSAPNPGDRPAELRDSDSSPFTPSSHTPHLSALFARIGRGGDLEEMVNEAKTRLDASGDTDLSSEDDDEGEGQHQENDQDKKDIFEPAENPHNLHTHGPIRGGRLPTRAAAISPSPPDRSPSNKGVHATRRPSPLPHLHSRVRYSSPYPDSPPIPTSAAQHSPSSESALINPSPTALNLSPHTLESHPAPSLVSDDGDYENTHSESESPSSTDDEADGRYLDIEVEEGHDDEIDALEGGNAAAAATDHHHLGLATSVKKPHAPAAARRSSALRSPTANRPGSATTERHVTFASPGRRSEGSRGAP